MKTSKEFRALTVEAKKAKKASGYLSVILIYERLIEQTGSAFAAASVLILLGANERWESYARDEYLVIHMQSDELRLKLMNFAFHQRMMKETKNDNIPF